MMEHVGLQASTHDFFLSQKNGKVIILLSVITVLV